jgi:hypothetical protein
VECHFSVQDISLPPRLTPVSSAVPSGAAVFACFSWLVTPIWLEGQMEVTVQLRAKFCEQARQLHKWHALYRTGLPDTEWRIMRWEGRGCEVGRLQSAGSGQRRLVGGVMNLRAPQKAGFFLLTKQLSAYQ